jgi:hypothetical protein
MESVMTEGLTAKDTSAAEPHPKFGISRAENAMAAEKIIEFRILARLARSTSDSIRGAGGSFDV